MTGQDRCVCSVGVVLCVCGGMWQCILYVYMCTKHVEDGGGGGACVCVLTCMCE